MSLETAVIGNTNTVRAYGEPDWENLANLHQFRGVPANYFEPYEEYIPEDESVQLPIPASPVEFVAQQRSRRSINNVGRAFIEAFEHVDLGNEELPIFDYREQVVQSVAENPITIITAETGAGKSTQVGQYLYDAGFKVAQTHPRRIAARNVYNRQLEEIASKLGYERAKKIVNFETAGEREGPYDARLRNVTDGLELARETAKNGVDEDTVVIVDEVHEGNCNIEFLTAWAKLQVRQNPKLKFVFMSATMDTLRLQNFFSDVTEELPPIIEVPGRMHHVERFEKPESTVAKETILAATEIDKLRKENPDTPSKILVFVPGKREINDTTEAIHKLLPPELTKHTRILPLHAKLMPEEQQAVMEDYAGVTIVVATNVAETSLTIPGVKYVIDSGLHRRMELDGNVQGLMLRPISQAECDQRAGRAGRVSEGIYILTRPGAKSEFVPYDKREKFPVAEILRTDITRNILRFAVAGYNLAELELFNPVESESIEQGQHVLRILGALDDNNQATELGRRMNDFPVGAPSARMMVEAERFSEGTRAYMAAIVASMEVGGLPYFAPNVGRRWQAFTKENASDHLAQLDIFIATQHMSKKQLSRFDLDVQSVLRAREQFQKIARLVGVEVSDLTAPTAQQREDMRHCIISGLVNGIFVHQSGGKYGHVGTKDEPREISNRSMVEGRPSAVVGTKYRIEVKPGYERHIIEGATAATLQEIGRAAVHLAQWETVDILRRDFAYVEKRRRVLFGIDLGITEEVAAVPSAHLREKIIDHALQQPGPNQVRLRSIKTRLEEFARLAKDPVPTLSQERFEDLVRRATPDDVTVTWTIDNNLGQLMINEGIALESFLSEERQEHILRNAPKAIEVDGVKLRLTYEKSRVYAKYSPSTIGQIQDDVFLPDGRQVYFKYDKKDLTLYQLRRALGITEDEYDVVYV